MHPNLANGASAAGFFIARGKRGYRQRTNFIEETNIQECFSSRLKCHSTTETSQEAALREKTGEGERKRENYCNPLGGHTGTRKTIGPIFCCGRQCLLGVNTRACNPEGESS